MLAHATPAHIDELELSPRHGALTVDETAYLVVLADLDAGAATLA